MKYRRDFDLRQRAAQQMQSKQHQAEANQGTAHALKVGMDPALAVMLGANIGSTLVVQLMSFNMEMAIPLLLLAGFPRAAKRWRQPG